MHCDAPVQAFRPVTRLSHKRIVGWHRACRAGAVPCRRVCWYPADPCRWWSYRACRRCRRRCARCRVIQTKMSFTSASALPRSQGPARDRGRPFSPVQWLGVGEIQEAIFGSEDAARCPYNRGLLPAPPDSAAQRRRLRPRFGLGSSTPLRMMRKRPGRVGYQHAAAIGQKRGAPRMAFERFGHHHDAEFRPSTIPILW